MSADELELAPLSPRQRLVCELIADGMTDKDICQAMRLSRDGVRAHLSRIALRLNLDRCLNLRVQLTWLVIHDRHILDATYRLKLPRAKRLYKAS